MGRIRRILPLTFVLYAFWILVTARFKLPNLLVGFAACAVLAAVSDYLIPSEFRAHFNAGLVLRFPLFSVLLIWEIIKANWDVWKRVMRPSLPIDPRVVEFESVLESDLARTVLAGAINLTPGTVTLDMSGPVFTVHCLAEETDRELMEGRLQRMVAWLFSEGPVEQRRMR